MKLKKRSDDLVLLTYSQPATLKPESIKASEMETKMTS